MKLLEWIKSLFTEQSHQACIEGFITSKNPTTPAEVDFWAREYDRRQSAQGWL